MERSTGRGRVRTDFWKLEGDMKTWWPLLFVALVQPVSSQEDELVEWRVTSPVDEFGDVTGDSMLISPVAIGDGGGADDQPGAIRVHLSACDLEFYVAYVNLTGGEIVGGVESFRAAARFRAPSSTGVTDFNQMPPLGSRTPVRDEDVRFTVYTSLASGNWIEVRGSDERKLLSMIGSGRWESVTFVFPYYQGSTRFSWDLEGTPSPAYMLGRCGQF